MSGSKKMKLNKQAQEIILEQYARYPKLQIRDIIKALYQSEFGCAHFVENENNARKYLSEELSRIENDKSTGEFIEPIGESFGRVHLRGMAVHGLSFETLLLLFIMTSKRRKTDTSIFIEKIHNIVDLCVKGGLPFTKAEAENIIRRYIKDGMKAVHHSEEFRNHYAPAYRVVSIDLCRYIMLFTEIERLLREHDTVTVAIEGKCTSGKTTLSNYLKEIYDCNVFSMDSFFLQKHQRTPERLSEPGGNVDYERFKSEVLDNLKSGVAFSYRPYDCSVQELSEPVLIAPKKLNIVEGVYSMHPTLEDAYDLKVYLDVGCDTQLERLTERNSEDMVKRFIEEWIPLENLYFDAMDIKSKCDMAIGADK